MEPPAGRIRVLVADDHALVRHGIAALLREAGAFEVVAEAGDGREAIQLAHRHAPDIVLLDAEMPGYSTIEALRQIGRLPGAPRVLLLGTRASESSLLDYLAAGATGLLLKEGTSAELILALRQVRQSAFYLSSGLSRKALDRWQRGAKPARRRAPDVAGGLSQRERQVLECVSDGLTNRLIAERLCISVKTVEAHKAHMISRLGLTGSGDLFRYAMTHSGQIGLLRPVEMTHTGGSPQVNAPMAEN
ncbi:MAG TPA: response regulator transcription factor [Chloroflexota bacterium]|nr:response regulator transcription factor [Chloroflexota bacterium]